MVVGRGVINDYVNKERKYGRTSMARSEVSKKLEKSKGIGMDMKVVVGYSNGFWWRIRAFRHLHS